MSIIFILAFENLHKALELECPGQEDGRRDPERPS